ncbi:MAG: GGDEF domain-containing protein [Erythrobacter sp.]
MGFLRILTLFAVLAALSTLGLAPGATSAALAADDILCNSSPDPAAREAGSGWRCASGKIDLDKPRNVVRLEVADGESPSYVISRTTKFGAISVGVVSEGVVTWNTQDYNQVEATFFDRQFAVPLPAYEGTPDAVLVAVDHATQLDTFDHLRLEAQLPGQRPGEIAMLLVVALFTGMMLMPILFDLVFHRVLREQFLLWHAALVGSLALQLACNFGLYLAFFDATLPIVRAISVTSFALMVMSAIMFSLRFIEKGKVPQWIRQTLYWAMVAHITFAIIHLAGIEALRYWPATLFFGSGLPLCVALVMFAGAALRNGSRPARYLAAGMAPLLAIAMTRAVTFIMPGVSTVDANDLMLFAALIEVTATAMGVASRFLTLKLESDRVHAEIDLLEGVASQDALTGLLNRRTIDERYEDLRAQGFDTFALIDLDLFKDVNDRFGHQTGDAVLIACAEAIRCEGDRDTIAVRLGGEEFVLLLRGERATQRAEALRCAIPQRVATDVEGLDRLVTASMGVLELPRDALSLMEFEEIYARADKLLYEAKASGRNRMLYERLRMFDPTAGRRSKAA